MAKMLLAVGLVFPQISHADSFDGNVFLNWHEDAKTAFLQNTMIMAALVSSRTNPEHGDCISAWFFDENGISPERQAEAIQKISTYKDYRPSAVLIAMIEESCGQFGQGN